MFIRNRSKEKKCMTNESMRHETNRKRRERERNGRHVKYVVNEENKFLIEKVVKKTTTTTNLLPCRTMLMKRTISQTRRTNYNMSIQ